MKTTVLILCGPGTNCMYETANALTLVGLESRIVQVSELLDSQVKMTDCRALIIPGGFSYGDHFGSGRIFALNLLQLQDQLQKLVETMTPIMGICNGFQALVETGLLPDRTIGVREAALIRNKSATFESRSVELLVMDTDSIWTQGLEGRILRMPVAHGEGRLFWENDDHIHPVVRYALNGVPTEEYPACPSGSPGGIAGIRDSTGLIFGLMPHPERACRKGIHPSIDGLKIFENLARHLGES